MLCYKYRTLGLAKIKFSSEVQTHYASTHEIEVPFDCVLISTIAVITKEINAGIFIFHAGYSYNEHFFLHASNFKDYGSEIMDEKWEELKLDRKKPLRYSATAYDNHNSIYITGGCYNSTTTKECLLFDTSTKNMQQISALNQARESHATFLCK